MSKNPNAGPSLSHTETQSFGSYEGGWLLILHRPPCRLAKPLVLESSSLAGFRPCLRHLPGQLGTSGLRHGSSFSAEIRGLAEMTSHYCCADALAEVPYFREA